MQTDGHNPFAALEAEIVRGETEKKAASAITAARTRLILGKDARDVFFCLLALRLKVSASWEIDTAYTDGERLLYNPEFVAGLTPAQCTGMLVHEVMHCAMAHMSRRRSRDHDRWNIACDLAVNSVLVGAGFQLPSDGFIPGRGQYAKLAPGLSAEAYYAALQDQSGDGGSAGGAGAGTAGAVGVGEVGGASRGAGQGDGQGGDKGNGTGKGQGAGDGESGGGGTDPGGCGAVRDAGDPATQGQREAEWKVATAQAERAAKSRGTLPAGLCRTIEEIVAPQVDWKDVLRRFTSQAAKNDYAWMPPNRRFLHRGLYLPSVRGEDLGEVVVVVDCSGSIGKRTLAVFAAELEAVLEAYSVKLTIIYHDAEVSGTQEWSSDDGPLALEPVGGGETDHQPVFKYIDENVSVPTCVLCLTDGYTRYPTEKSPYPVLWVMTSTQVAPFGETIQIKE